MSTGQPMYTNYVCSLAVRCEFIIYLFEGGGRDSNRLAMELATAASSCSDSSPNGLNYNLISGFTAKRRVYVLT